jgi:glycosyltransferase involved in cell wall biosynthesis
VATVSVIIPNYNHAAYLEQRINSVLDQTYTDFEVIILDDCSTDDSRSVITRFETHPKVSHVVFNESNSGSTFKQWEKGIELAKGKYIWIAESDDYCESNFLETIMKAMSGNDNCVMGYAQSYVIDEADQILWQSGHSKLADTVQGNTFIKKHLLYGNGIYNASMAVFRKDAYYKISDEFLSFKFCGDWLFWIEMAGEGSVFISGKALNFFRKHAKDVSGKVYKTGYNFFEEVGLLDLVKEKNVITGEEYKKLLVHKYEAYLNTRHTILKENQSEIEKLFSDKKVAKASIARLIKRKVKKILFS